MKKSTCKILLGIGIIILITGLLVLGFVQSSFGEPTKKKGWYLGSNLERTLEVQRSIMLIVNLRIFLTFIGLILIIIAWSKWNSELKGNRKEELRQAQLKALRKGKVNVKLKGKMRKLR